MPAGGFAASAIAPLNPELMLVTTVTDPDAPRAMETDAAFGVTLNGGAMVSVRVLIFC